MSGFYVAPARSGGKGVFAKAECTKGKQLFVVQGTAVKAPYGPDYHIGPRWLAVGQETWVVPSRCDLWWYINHSCKPNAGLKGGRRVIAIRDIKPGDEITIDYSTTEADPYWRMECSCGESNCRRVIRSIQYFSPRDFARYRPFLPRFLQRSYNRDLKPLPIADIPPKVSLRNRPRDVRKGGPWPKQA